MVNLVTKLYLLQNLCEEIFHPHTKLLYLWIDIEMTEIRSLSVHNTFYN